MSGWPAFALLTAVKLLFGLLERPPTGSASATVPTVRQAVDRPWAEPGTVPADGDADRDEAGGRTDGRVMLRTGQEGEDRQSNETDGGRTDQRAEHPDGRPARGDHPSTSTGPAALDVSALRPAARLAQAALARKGLSLSREALARQLRADGHAASNARVSAVLRALTAEAHAADGTSTDTAA